MQKVMSTIICEAQAGFIPGRKLGDNIVLAHELVQGYNRKHVSPRRMIKIDLQEAYDSIEWVYLKQVMEELGFPTKYTTWVLECVSTVSYSIIINGEPTLPFEAARGLRQGDPMSPFLFAIGMEYLSRMLNGLKEIKEF
ncbi:secreted RxLR effector protein 78-like [Lycium ferocissimum]|uniref:secreted RxLR effector protein 78-like n=1 Tax=Lycium ferocissimum TaxID=112874 RepID=UPI00281658A3|nr:secreted RxLR effector protein 78-like [Lycium ferocissimum]